MSEDDLTLRHPSLQLLVQTNMTGELTLESEQTLSGYRHNFSEHDNWDVYRKLACSRVHCSDVLFLKKFVPVQPPWLQGNALHNAGDQESDHAVAYLL